jgi:glycosyltransferase involved in cell wall biosynthesis
VPVVSTDVGSCRELIEGRLPEDRALGAAGAVVPIAAPLEASAAMVKLLKDKDAWWKAREAGLQRVRTYYTRAQMFASYRALYQTALEAAAHGGHRVRAS